MKGMTDEATNGGKIGPVTIRTQISIRGVGSLKVNGLNKTFACKCYIILSWNGNGFVR